MNILLKPELSKVGNHGPYISWLLEISAHIQRNIFYLTCLRYLIRTRATPNRIFSYMREQNVLSYNLI